MLATGVLCSSDSESGIDFRAMEEVHFEEKVINDDHEVTVEGEAAEDRAL
jgi:hypothetical protein